MTCINRGCDDNLFMDIPFDPEKVVDYQIEFKQDSRVVLTREKAVTEIANKILRVPLGANETALWSPHRVAIRILYTDINGIRHKTEATTIVVR